MPLTETSRTAVKKRVNLTIDEDLIAAARELGLNASSAAEAGLRAAVKRAREEEWLRENRAAIEAYNRRIEKDGPLLVTPWTKEIWERFRNGEI